MIAKWIIDPDHSVASFSVPHFMIADVHGQFNRIKGSVDFDPSSATSISVSLEIDVQCIFTGISKRDEHLKSEDFFDVQTHSRIIFRSTKTEVIGFSKCRITGDLTMRGKTHPVTVDAAISGPVNSPFGETSIGITGYLKVNREDFGIMWNEPMENGGVVAGKYVEVVINIEADLS